MAIDTKNLGSIQAYQKLAGLHNQSENALNKANENSNALQNRVENPSAQGSVQASQMTIRNERQASLVAHLFGDGQSAQENSLKLTFQAAIEKLNEVLSAEFAVAGDEESGPAPISEEALKKQGGMEYWTPENTAKRISDGATAFLGGFQKAHPELEGEELINRFMEVVGGGITQGFGEARGILDDLNVLEGSIADNIDTTYQLVQNNLNNFKNQFLGINDTVENTSDTVTDTAEEKAE